MCPPGADQTTRSPQSWCMMVPGVREKHGVNFMAKCRSRASTDEVDCWAWSRLARLDPELLERPDLVLRLNPRPQSSSSLMNLPLEITLSILAYLDKTSILSLAASCLLCTHRFIPHIDQQILTGSAPWANEPLACLGTYLTTLPPAFEHEKFALRSVGLEDLVEPDLRPLIMGHYRDRMCVARKYNWRAIHEYAGPWRRYFLGHDREELKYVSEHQSWLSALSAVERMGTKSDGSPEITMRVLKQVLSRQRFYGLASLPQTLGIEVRPRSSHQIHRLVDGLRKRKACTLDDHTDQYRVETPTKLNSIWYLRNLDTKEFIRLVPQEAEVNHKKKEMTLNQRRESARKTLESGPERVFELCCPEDIEQRTCLAAAVMHEGSQIIPVEIVIALRTYWHDGLSTRFQHNTTNTPIKQQMPTWAGHRFDMVTENMHQKITCVGLPGVQRDTADSATSMGRSTAAHETSGMENQVYNVSSDDRSVSIQTVEWRDVTDESVRIVQQYFGPES